MSEDLTHQIKFGRLAVTLPATDISRALAFYVGVLGFNVTFKNGQPTRFAILRRDEAELHLNLVPAFSPPTCNSAHLLVNGVEALHAHCKTNNVEIVQLIRDHDYGLRSFVIADVDGNRIDIGEEL